MPLPVVVLASLAHGAESAAPSVPPHPLVIAIETLYQRSLPNSCDEVMKQASSAPGLTLDDFIRLLWVEALRRSDEDNQLAARKALSQVLQLDQSARPPAFASTRLGKMLEEARLLVPLGGPPKDKGTPFKAPAEREPAAKALLRVVDALYANLEIEGATIVNDMALSVTPLTATDRAQAYLRLGILRMESSDEAGARTAFREALEADGGARLPDYSPPRTLRVFLEVKATTVAAGPPAIEPVREPAKPVAVPTVVTHGSTEKPPEVASRTWGLAVGGAGAALVVGGAVAGAVALSAYQAERSASTAGDWDAYSRNRDAAKTAINVADGLYGAGAVALGVGAYLYLRTPTGVTVEAGAGRGRVSLAVEGCF